MKTFYRVSTLLNGVRAVDTKAMSRTGKANSTSDTAEAVAGVQTSIIYALVSNRFGAAKTERVRWRFRITTAVAPQLIKSGR